MTLWAHIFLGAIAAATVVMAVIQIGAIIYAGRLARRVERLVDQVELEVKPMLSTIARDAARASALAVTQVERADQLFGDLSQRLTETVAVLQDGLLRPAREGRAVISGLCAAFAAIRSVREDLRTRSRSEDEDALFI